ncbi:MAG: hypothetical protein LUF82_00815 [Clostridia bacterium]|nr:hypothetical protein [Clostridia bacterium]
MIYVLIGVAAVIGVLSLIVGLVKGYTRTSTWATEYILAAVLTVLIVTLTDAENDIINACVAIGVAICLLLVFAFMSNRAKNYIGKKSGSARKRSYYESYYEREENTMMILDALERNDKKAYRDLTKRKMKEKSGSAGVFDRILGGLNLLVEACVICCMLAVIVLLVLDFTQISLVTEGGSLYSVYTGGVWEFISPYIFDFLIIAVLQYALRAGYRAGVLRALWFLIVAALVGGAGYLAYHLAFNVDSFITLAENLSESIGLSTTISQVIVLASIFVIALIVVLVVGIVVAGMLSRAREDRFVQTADGVLGAIVFTAVCHSNTFSLRHAAVFLMRFRYYG